MLRTREEVVEASLRFPGAYEDYPFDDPNWTVMRRRDTKRGFAWIYERGGKLCVNLKAEPETALFWRSVFPSVTPAYHMNKEHWNTVILDGSVPEETLLGMLEDSYTLCGKSPSRAKKGNKWGRTT